MDVISELIKRSHKERVVITGINKKKAERKREKDERDAQR